MRFLMCLTQEHNLWLVALAAFLCLVGSTITFGLFRRLRYAERSAAPAWIFMGGVATGATIWCTHFVAMMAYRPGAAVTYEPLLTGLSLVLAILGSGLALSVGAREGRWSGEIGGVIFGLAVTVMHYTGMAAFAVRGAVLWDTAVLAGSVLGAVVLGALAFRQARAAGREGTLYGAVALMVASIVVLHFTGMAAMTIVPFAPMGGQLNGGDATVVMAFAVAGIGLLILGTGVSSHALDLQSRAESRRSLDELLEGSVDGMVVVREGVILAANAGFAALAGVPQEVMFGNPLENWLPAIDTVSASSLTQLSMLNAHQAEIPVEVALRRDERRKPAHLIYAVRDLRARLAQEKRIAHLARNDSLTGLPNRASFLDWLERQTAPGIAQGDLALLSIDLDRFKEVNDTHGHAVGDRLLIHIAERMKATLRPGEFVARLGGDEFIALMPLPERDAALDLIDRLREAVTTPMDMDDGKISCGLSVGVAIWPQDAEETSTLINNADLAMYRAKSSISTDVCFYEEEMDKAVRDRRRMVKELREALDNEEFSLHWQVQASVRTGEITGYEALLRWNRPDGTSVSPDQFIPLAEQCGLILPLGEWVLRTACREAAAWSEPHKIAVNLSPVQLAHVDLPGFVLQVLLESGLSPSRLELEITETAMITDLERTTHILRQLKGMGIGVAMDDFGTGYSSLSTLRAFPFDKIKLDRSFMTELDQAPQSAAIVRAVLALGESLSIPVLAEGVETVEQLAFLREQGCQEAQGYLLGRPRRLTENTTEDSNRLAWIGQADLAEQAPQPHTA
ncbi:bifunctional diguanylate cyclase/phosphodiesterase [Novosphingobium terrae]|uniref:bifunctional diguanylate cyclase/phosphodiesterase n=1 Tax=Novosphingobium terrae TaxID=2726189 RepID=UPI00197E2CBB|nr:bifunctional diguanylate cyclase/phosphodiesterase [Novosphingobium terrae]